MRSVFPALAALLLFGCAAPRASEGFSRMSERFVYESLALSPVTATAVGYRQHNGSALDEALDDFSRPALQRRKAFFTGFRARLEESVKANELSAEDRADYDILNDQLSLGLLELDTIQNFRHNPTLYVELIGNALFTPYTTEYAPKDIRYRHIIARLTKIPNLLSQATLNLTDAPEVWTRVAEEENQGNIDLIEHTLRDGCPFELRAEYDRAAAGALASLRRFSEWLATDLAAHTSDWRLGEAKYRQKFRYALGTNKSPAALLKEAEETVAAVRGQMQQLAGTEGVKAALDRIAQRHATPETYFADARRDLAEATEFVRTQKLMDLPDSVNLQVIATPEFMRGIYGVGGFNPAPALEPKLGAYYWITPIPPGWPKDRIESKLREYNFHGLKILTVHEAMPGHWVQAEFAAKVQPAPRRLLRAVYGNGPYIEGWAVYATEVMVNEGYLNNDRDLKLTWYKQLLRAVANAIMDIRLHTMGMTEEQAMDLMVNQTYQECEEAVAKWQRAQLSSCQLPMYFLGYAGWLEARKSTSLGMADFHNRALKVGAVRLPSLPLLLKGLL